MPETFAVVALDLQPTHPHFQEYNDLLAEDKIKYLAARIESICENLKDTEPNSNWIFVWREYGITDADSRYLSPAAKKTLKDTMAALTAKYKQLTIVSGSVATKKHFDHINKNDVIKKVEKYYEDNPDILKDDLAQGIFHQKQIEALKQSSVQTGIDVVRNTSYIFSKGTCIGRRDKTDPYLEVSNVKQWWETTRDEQSANQLESTIFQPGSKKDRSSVFEIPTINNNFYKIAIEICREHSRAKLQREVAQNPLFQFVVSFGMITDLSHVSGDYYLLLDNVIKPILLVNNPPDNIDFSKLPVRLYQHDALDKVKHIRGPLKPVYPPEKRFLEEFNLIRDTLQQMNFEDKANKEKAFQKVFRDFIYALGNGDGLRKFVDNVKSSTEYSILTNPSGHDTSDDNYLKMLERWDSLLHEISKTVSSISPKFNVDELPKASATTTYLFKPKPKVSSTPRKGKVMPPPTSNKKQSNTPGY